MSTKLNETKSLAQVVSQKAYPDFAAWWSMGHEFLTFMSDAICSQWRATVGQTVDVALVQADVDEYMQLVYQRSARTTLALDFAAKHELTNIKSGEFDALSYAFYKTAFDVIAAQYSDSALIRAERHAFTQRIGQLFYCQLHDHLSLNLPKQLQTDDDFEQLTSSLHHVGEFLKQQGYLRDHFAFHFDVDQQYGGNHIVQQTRTVIQRFNQDESVYALYEMGYPAILPSAVYLYQTLGEAQHHSSRTIEELFGRIGYLASETPEFDPTGYPSDMVVELWQIQRKAV